MLKKFTWIAALLVVFAMVLVGCGEPKVRPPDPSKPPPGAQLVDVFVLSEILKDLPAGVLAEGSEPYDTLIDETFLQAVGDITTNYIYAIVEKGDVKALTITTVVSWSGLDLKDEGFGFRAGDKIFMEYEFTGIAGAGFFLNALHSSYAPIVEPKWNSTTEIEEWEIELTSAHVNQIRKTSGGDGPATLRIRSNEAGSVITLYELVVSGYRTPGGDAPPPVCSCTDEDCECDCEEDCGPTCPGCPPIFGEPTESAPLQVEMKAVEGSLTILSATSYEFTREASWQESYAWFTVNFGESQLSDFSRVSFTYQGIEGDIGHKNFDIVASSTDFSASLGNDNAVEAARINLSNSRPQVDGTDPIPVLINLDPTKTAAYDATKEVRFTLFLNANVLGTDEKSTKFKISDIVFQSFDPNVASIAITFDHQL